MEFTALPEDAGGRKRILVVEDSPTQAAELSLILEEAGYEVDVASDGKQGLDCVTRSRFDLVLADVLMPGMSGFELCRQIKESGAQQPVFLVTTLNGVADILRGLESGADSYLNKPYEPEELLVKIERFLGVRNGDTVSHEPALDAALSGTKGVSRASGREPGLTYFRSVVEHFARRQRAEEGTGVLRTAEALQRSEERLTLAALGGKHAIWDWDLDRGEIYFSPRWQEMLRLGDAPPQGHPNEWFSRIHAEDRSRVAGELKAHLDGAIDYFESEHRIQCGDGTYAWVLVCGRAVRDAAARPYRIAGSLEDISTRKQTEQDLLARGEALTVVRDIAERTGERATLCLLQFSADHAPNGVFWLGSNARLLYANAVACRVFGYAAAELLSMSLHDLAPELTPDAWPRQWKDIKQRGELEMEFCCRTKTGESTPIAAMTHFVASGGDEYVCAFIAGRT